MNKNSLFIHPLISVKSKSFPILFIQFSNFKNSQFLYLIKTQFITSVEQQTRIVQKYKLKNYFPTMSGGRKLQKSQNHQNKDILAIFQTKTKNYIFHRNYLLTSKSTATYIYAVILNVIFFVQQFIIISLPMYNTAVKEGVDMYVIFQKCVFLIFKFKMQINLQNNAMAIAILAFIQAILLFSYLIPFKSKQANIFISKYIIQTFSTIAYFPSIFIATQNILNSTSLSVSLLTFFLTLLNRLIFVGMHFEFSIEGQNENILIRNTMSLTKEVIAFFFIVLFMLCKQMLYPMSLLVFFLVNIIFCLLRVKEYCIGFNYHHQSIPKLLGILTIMKISIALCYFIVIATEISLVKNNILTFIMAFFIFFANFFLVFKKHSTKSIVIDSDGDTQTKKIVFIMWYFNCFRNRAQKKNELYLSSLLKNHSSQCLQLSCCCKKRSTIFDPSSNLQGSPTTQPHHDIVYIKHFFLKLLTQTYKKFPKSNKVVFLLAFYNLEILNFIPQTIELIKLLKKKSLKKNLSFSEDYLLYCLGQRCYEKINQINHVKGNLDLEKVRMFDSKILQLKDTIKFSVQTFSSLWKTICSEKYNQKNLVEICKVALEIMFKIEENYKDIKKINNVSTQLKELMILYSKCVAHDIHLLSEVRKQIKLSAQNSIVSNSIQIKGINIFSPDTITLITSEISSIRWASKNCFSIFGYKSRQQFLKLRINDLMPKYFGKNHDNYINKWLQTGFSSKINKNSYLWGSTKQGFCFSLAIYIKIIPLQTEQDFAFFAAIQKIDIDNQIICDQWGSILGCGRLFASTIKCSQKSIQDYKPNIQIFMPSTFDLFLQSFYSYKKFYNHQNLNQVKRQGYFPKNLQIVMKQLFEQRQHFINRNNRKTNFKALVCNFMKQKMQEITVYMDGQYISITAIVHYIPVLQNKTKNIIVFKLTGTKKNNVEKYYDQLEKTISKLEMIKLQNKGLKKNKQKGIKSRKSVKKDYFKVFLNPKRVKKLLEQQGQELQPELNTLVQFYRLDALNSQQQIPTIIRQRNPKDSCIIDQDKIIGYRKKLALNAQFYIKNQRARYNIWKIKKALFDQGIFSRYTFNMLVGKSNDFETMKNIARSEDVTNDFGNGIAGIVFEEDRRDMSDDDLLSDNMTNRAEADKIDKDKEPGDNETFNSATSSAAFISMTNSIKMFKIKLRSLNTPKLLYWLNVALIVVTLLIASFGIFLWISQQDKMDLGQIYFTKAVLSTWIMDSLLMGKILTVKSNHISLYSSLFNASYYAKVMGTLQQRKKTYLNVMHSILAAQQLQLAELQKRDSQIFRYLQKKIKLVETHHKSSGTNYLKTVEFMMREQVYAKQNLDIRNSQEINLMLKGHEEVFEDNLYYKGLENIEYIVFFGGLTAFVMMLVLSMPIVYKIESKVEQIMYLISKISLNQRRRYFLQFTVLSQELQKLNQTDSWMQIEEIQQVKLKNMTLQNTRQIQGHEQLTSNPSDLKKKKSSPKDQSKQYKNKFYETIYFKIVVIYMIFLSVYCAKFIDIRLKFDNFLNQNDIFTKILTEKLKLTQQSFIFNQFLSDDLTDQIKIGNSDLVRYIYQSYHLNSDENTSDYNNFIKKLTTGNICDTIKYEIEHIKDDPNFIGYFQFKSDRQVADCSTLNGGSLTKGLFTTFDYLQQKRIHVIHQPYDQRIKFIKSNESVLIEDLFYYSNTISYMIQRKLQFEVRRQKTNLVLNMGIWLLVVGGFLLAFTVGWVFIYLNIAQRASYINAFLLLIPYQVLSENPYIKLYIKNQFDYKSSVY